MGEGKNIAEKYKMNYFEVKNFRKLRKI